ncbi:sialidase family protein [Geomonas edaphica]|uniref:sialidase family protein n=1 Tax=Geomonas edaphica TaxID=2570226 RepID=UPI0010A8C307|nr:sialidase family protein [Geomonas edaphica]
MRRILSCITVAVLMVILCCSCGKLPPAKLISDIYCDSNDTLVALGLHGRGFAPSSFAFFSEDRGATWQQAAFTPVPSNMLLSLRPFPCGNVPALCAGGYTSVPEGSRWWCSKDGGRTWDETQRKAPFVNPSGSYSIIPDVAVAGEMGTLVAAEAGPEGLYLLRSTDCGAQWEQRLLLPDVRFASPIVSDGMGHLAFFGHAKDHLFGEQPKDWVYWSADAGANWQEAVSPYGFFLQSMRLYRTPAGSLLAYNSQDRNYGQTVVFYSVDDGASWKWSRGLDCFGRIISIAADSRGRVVAMTRFGNILISDDGGGTWRDNGVPSYASADFNYDPTPMIFTDRGVVITAVDNSIIRSTDRGETWSIAALFTAPKERISALCANGEGLVVAAAGMSFARSTDWGATWQAGEMR